MEEQQTEQKSVYSKRPLWQWILLYVVIGGIIYAGIYFAFLHKQNPYVYNKNNTTMPATHQNDVYKFMSKGKLGRVMTDLKGMTLYTFAKDKVGTSNCTGACLQAWPAYAAPSQTNNLPANISILKRSDGSLQYAWKGMPLYFYAKDEDSGDTYGNGINGLWSVIKQ